MNFSPQKNSLNYNIRFASSEDVDYPASQLLNVSQRSKGWQTQRFEVFPQSLILELNEPAQIESFQILSHQCKISTRVEVYCALPETNSNQLQIHEIAFRKIGYFSLSSNEQSNYRSRELKTVMLNVPCKFIKLVFEAPYVNSVNIFNQIGVIALQFYGDCLQRQTQQNRIEPNIMQKTQMDHKTLSMLQVLTRQKENAVQNEDFLLAKQLVDKIKQLQQVSNQLKQLEERKLLAVENDDFDTAIVLNNEIKNIKKTLGLQDENVSINTNHQQNNYQSYQSQQLYENEQQTQNNYNNSSYVENFQKSNQDQNDQQIYQSQYNSNNPYQTPYKNDIQKNIQDQQLGNESQMTKFSEKVIPAIKNKNNKQKIDEYPPEYQSQQKQKPIEDIKLSKKAIAQMNDYLDYFEENFLKYCFSSNWMHKKQSCEQIIEFLTNSLDSSLRLPNDFITTNNQNQLFIQIWKLNNEFLQQKIPRLVQDALEINLLLGDLKTNKNDEFVLNSSQIQKQVESTLDILLDKLNDFKNPDVFDKVVSIYNTIIRNQFVDAHDILAKLSLNKGLAKKHQAAKYLQGRLQMCCELIKVQENNINIDTFNLLLDFSTQNLENQNVDIRDQAKSLIINISQIIGSKKVIKFLEKASIRQIQLDEIQRELTKSKQEGNLEQDYENQKNQTKKGGYQNNNKVQQEEEKHQNEQEFQQLDYNEQEQEEIDEEEEDIQPGTCHFCRVYNENFLNENKYNQHLWKECPVLYTCKLCNQVIEVIEYNDHLLDSCEKASLFQKCNYCAQAIQQSKLDKHLQTECQGEEIENKCPLCYQVLELNTDDLYECFRDHLINIGCKNNPRTTNS